MSKPTRPKIVVLGSMCRLPVAGVVYQILHYMLGLERLGCEAWYVEWHGNWVEDPTVPPAAHAPERVFVADVMRRFGFEHRWVCQAEQLGPGRTFGGLDAEALPGLYAEAAAIFNVTGAHFIDEHMRRCPRRLYIETDPGIPQIRVDNGDPQMLALLAGHTHSSTFAENFADASCLLPAKHLDYRTTRQPVVLDLWPDRPDDPRPAFTTVARWRKHKEKAVDFRGARYRWNKDGEFLQFIDLPGRSGQQFEMALAEVGPEDRERLRQFGWSVVDAVKMSSSLVDYNRYISQSRGEFTIAKDQYVRLYTGWFSDRSACYLAAGRPVITQDTGFGCALPTGTGLFAFSTVDDILAALEAIAADYSRHARAAREIAQEFFCSDRVLTDLLDWLEIDR